jgi:hypothetical protein
MNPIALIIFVVAETNRTPPTLFARRMAIASLATTTVRSIELSARTRLILASARYPMFRRLRAG